MLRVAMLALGATLTIGALAPQDAAAQTGRQRSQGRGGVIVQQPRSNDRVLRDGRCYDNSRVDRRRGDDDDRYEGRGKGKKDKDRYSDRRRDDDDRYEDGRYRNGSYDPDCDQYSSREGKGPKFCQNGQGHPVYGMAWCRDKGFGLRNTGWQDVILRRPRYDTRSDLGRSVLQDVLGRVVYGRFDSQRSRLGVRQPLVGRWLDTSNGSMLNLFAGGLQIAQILDRNRDGRADVVMMNYGR
ncbi:MAG TPA: hypothetical protein VF021_10635 [Longimicrobiales bacterium]